MKPTRSANRIVTSRRSATGPVSGPDGPGRTVFAGRGVVPATSGVAHSPQKRMSASFGAPHEGHSSASGAAQPPQNLRPDRFSVPQFEQTTQCSGAT